MTEPRALFSAVGVELEYMIVGQHDLNVAPIADVLLAEAVGEPAADFEDGPVTWSNELVAHVIELKTGKPAASFEGWTQRFQESVEHVNRRLAAHGAKLLPTAMHPWMNPDQETKLWPLENSEVYQTFDRIFNCRGHGWSNLQSVHLNLPFANDAEFARLHAAIRLLLPLLPALAASSPLRDGQATGLLDNRLEAYRHNSARIPQVAGLIVPEPVYSAAEYQRLILHPLYAAIAPFDPDSVLQEEWLNARGAIARFDRQTIEIRVLDIQECPAADLALLTLIVAVLKSLVAETWTPLPLQQTHATAPLHAIFLATLAQAGEVQLEDPAYTSHFGYAGPLPCTVQQLWADLMERHSQAGSAVAQCRPALDVVLQHGCLARRIMTALGTGWGPEELRNVYGRLADCLATGNLFRP